jgi:hypothetical protein
MYQVLPRAKLSNLIDNYYKNSRIYQLAHDPIQTLCPNV